jgi:superkiller protein 3
MSYGSCGHRRRSTRGRAKAVLAISLLLFLSWGCGKKTDQAKKHLDLGLQYFEEKQMEEALQELRQAVQLDPDYADAHYYLGGLYHTLRAYSTALKEYREVLRINPDYRRIHTAMANVYYERGLKTWGKAVKLDRVAYWFPDTSRHLPFKNKDELLALIKGYEDKLRADTVDAETLSKLSQAHYLLAVEEYEKAVQVDAMDTSAHLYLGLTYSEQGYPQKASAQQEILAKVDPNAAELLLGMLKQKEKEMESLEEFKKRR